MAQPPIVLWTAKAHLTSDDACTTILQYQLASPPSATQAPYYRPPSAPTLSYVPPLVYFCIKSLLGYPDQVYLLGPARLLYRQPTDGHDFDILQALIPTYRPFSPNHRDFDLRVVDPRLWAVLAQIYRDLPTAFREYTLPLSDVHLPLLQAIPSTDHFSLITVLSLAKCRELTDDTVLELRHLHTLAALDASVTALGTWGVQRLARSLSWTDGDEEQRPERRGPWGLRVLYLRDCINVDDKIFGSLSHFPLLSVVDLRGTVCKPWQHQSLPFRPSSDKRLYQPGALSEVLGHLASLTKKPWTLFSHPAPYVLNVDSLYHKVDPTPSYRRSTNLWGVEGPDARPAEHGARHGRTDVFLEHEWPRPQSESPPHEDYEPMSHISGNVDELYRAEDGSDVEDENDEEAKHSEGDEYNEEVGSIEKDGHSTAVFQIPEDPSRPSDMSDPSAVDMSSQRARRRASPQPEFSMWMNDIADEELALYKRQRLVERFYSFSGPRRVMSLSDISGRGVDPLPSTTGSTSHAPADPLMLFRTPPPWSSLPSSPPAKPSSTAAATSTFPSSNASSSALPGSPPPKRRRVEDVAPADQVRKRTHALSSIRAMISMRQSRTTDGQPSAGDRAQSSNVPAKRNPFARASGAQTRKPLNMQPAGPPSPKAVSKLKSASTAKTLTPARDAVRATHTGDMAARGDRVSGSSLTNRQPLSPIKPAKAPDKPLPAGSPHPSGKKLKPITTLKIPDCPISMKPLSAHRPQAPGSAKATKQTTLPVSRDAVSPKPKPPLSNSKSAAAKPTSGRRVSAPASVPNRSDCGPANITAKGKNTPAKSTNKSGPAKGKTPNGGKGFDWKGWSTPSKDMDM